MKICNGGCVGGGGGGGGGGTVGVNDPLFLHIDSGFTSAAASDGIFNIQNELNTTQCYRLPLLHIPECLSTPPEQEFGKGTQN